MHDKATATFVNSRLSRNFEKGNILKNLKTLLALAQRTNRENDLPSSVCCNVLGSDGNAVGPGWKSLARCCEAERRLDSFFCQHPHRLIGLCEILCEWNGEAGQVYVTNSIIVFSVIKFVSLYIQAASVS